MESTFQLSEKENAELHEITDPAVALEFWKRVGTRLGFDPKTAKGGDQNLPFFVAEPTAVDLVEVRPLQKDLLSIEHVQSWTAMQVVDDESEKVCGERMNLLYEHRDKLKADRDSVVKPLQLAIKRVDDMANPILQPIKSAYDALNLKLGTYLQDKRRKEEAALRKKREEEAAKIKAEAEKQKTKAVEIGDGDLFDRAEQKEKEAERSVAAPVQLKQKSKTESGASFVPVTRWYARVIDADKVPRQFLVVDESQLQRYATAMKEKAEVSGVEFYSETKTQRKTA